MTETGSTADLAFVNGAVYTMDAARRWATGVAVRRGEVVAVGSDREVSEHIGPATEIVDLAGRMLLPGFQDAHVHPVSAGLEMLRCDLNEGVTAPEYLAIVATYGAEHPDEPWISGGGWSMDAFPGGTPSRQGLDEVAPDRPVFLHSRDGHSAWVNTRALEAAGITAATPDPPDGRIDRDPGGEPSGGLQEGAMRLVDRLLPAVSAAELGRGLRLAQAHLHALGITAWQDAIVQADDAMPVYQTYVEAADRGDLTARVVGALWWDRARELDQIEGFLELRARAGDGRFRATSVKIMQDGVCENFTAAVLEPYLDGHGTPTENRGISFVEPELLNRAVTALDAEGFQVHVHALAERAVREALDAIQAALAANGPTDNRHHLAHLQIVHPDDIPRFARLGVTANVQPLWAAHEAQMDTLTIPFLGEPRWRWQYPFASLVRAGAMLAMGSDWSVSSPDPLEEMHVGVNRRMPDDYPHPIENHEVFLPDERLDLPTALAAFTIGSAYVNHLDHVTGSIEPGKRADLAVLDRNLFDHPVERLSDASVDQTFVDGISVYERT